MSEVDESLELTKEEKAEFTAILSNKSVKKVLAQIQSEGLERDSLMRNDLITDEGFKMAVLDQGLAKGLFRSLEILYENTEPEDEDYE